VFTDEPGTERILWMFSLVLGHSRMLWAGFVLHQGCCAARPPRSRRWWDAIIQGLVDSWWALLSLRAMLKLLQPKPKRLAGPAPRAQLSHTAKAAAKKRKRIATAKSAR
jgi:hypothetical protein